MAAPAASAAQRAAQLARRAWPFVLMAWERWQALPPAQRERYLRQARGYADRGRTALDRARDRRSSRRGRR
jgi:hypothetical protein